MILFPYKNGSSGAKDLADALGIRQIKRERSRFRGSQEKLVINWGSSETTEEVSKCQVLNKPEAVALATNKLRFFQHINFINRQGNDYCEIPLFYTSINQAASLIDAGYKVVCRTVLTGHSGEGIVIASTTGELVTAPLYVQYRPKKREYRVHVFTGEVVDVQRKARDLEVPEERVNWQVRNHDNGFVYVRDENINDIPRQVLGNALAAVRMCGLDFGAVDVIYNEATTQASVLEINTAPGLSGTTLEGYRERFEQFHETYKNITNGHTRRVRQAPAQQVAFPGEIPEPTSINSSFWQESFAQTIARATVRTRELNAAIGIPENSALQAAVDAQRAADRARAERPRNPRR